MNSFKSVAGILFSACFLALLAANDGQAQTANSSSTSASGSNSASGSQSGAAAIVGGQTTTINGGSVPANTTANNTLNDRVSGGTNNTLSTTDRSTSDVTFRTTPTVYAPPVSGGNPCTLAVSAGASVIGWGAAAGATFVDQDCANRQKIAMVHNAGYKGVAKELMCNDRATYEAFKSSGEGVCAFRPDFEPKGSAPVAQPRPTVIVPAPVVEAQPKVYPRCNPRRGIVDNCAS